MKRLFLLLTLLLLCAGCAARSGNMPAASGTPTQTAPAPFVTGTAQTETEPVETGVPPGELCAEPEAPVEGNICALYALTSSEDFDGALQWSYRFDGLSAIDYDAYDAPVRFDGDRSLWMTYDRDGSFDNCIVGRCISTQAEWDWFDRVLLSAEYEADPEGSIAIGTPVFILRQGSECGERTSRIPSGSTGHIDDELYRYYVSPDGSVLRCDANGREPERIVTPLEPEAVARLYLLYDTYYRTSPVCYPCRYYPEEYESCKVHLLVRRDGEEISVPREQWDAFLAMVTVEKDKEYPDDLPCFGVRTRLFDPEDYPSPELLRFTFYTEDYDPNSESWQRNWFSLREDGRLILELPGSGGWLQGLARWTVYSPVRFVSKAVFDPEAITRLVFGE